MTLRDNKIVLIGLGVALAWWILESSLHFFLFSEGAFIQELFFPITHELWMRTLTLVVIIAFGISAQILFNREKRAEEEVRRTHAELDRIFQTAADGMRVVDRDFNVLRMNDTFLKLAGIRREDAAGRKCYEVFKGPLCHTPGCPLTRILAGEEHFEEEVEKGRADGKKIPCIITATPFRKPGGDVIGIVEDFSDITELKHAEEELKKHRDNLQELVAVRTAELTESNEKLQQEIAERKQAEEALKESERRLTDIIDFLPDATFVIDKYKRVIAWNRAIEQMTGISKKNIIGKGNYAYALPFYGDTIPILIDSIFSGYEGIDSRYKNVKSEGDTINAEVFVPSMRGGEGAFVWATASALYDDAGTIIGAIESIRDITDRKQAEEALKESEEMHRLVLEFAGISSTFWTTDGHLLMISRYGAANLGGAPGDFIGKPITELFGPDAGAVYLERIRQVTASGIKMEFEDYVPLPEGERWFFSVNTCIMDALGQVKGVMIFSLDITQRKVIEQALRESENRLSDIIDFLPDATFVIDKEGKVIAWNRAIEEMTGINKEAMIGKGNYEYALPFYRVRRPILIDFVVSGRPGIEKSYTGFSRAGSTLYAEVFVPYVYEGKGGYLAGTASRLISADGTVYGAIESIRDITEHKKAEEALKASEERLNLAIESANLGVWDMDTVTREMVHNLRWAEMLGYSDDEVEKPSTWWGERVHPDDYPLVLKNSEAHYAGKALVFDAIYRMKHKDGNWRWVHSQGKVFARDSEGRPLRMIGINQDVTERKQAEELQRHFTEELEKQVTSRTAELNASLEEKIILLHEIHHRVKNNLQIIISLLNLQSRTIADENTRQVIRESQNRIKAMALVHEKLHQSTDLSRINLEDYFRFLGTSLFQSYNMKERDITFRTDVRDIFIDINTAIPLGLIFNELISNSLKHAFPEGRKGEITVAVKRENTMLTILYKDNGVGISEDLNWRNTKSLGLRLIISLVKQLQGTIEVERTAGTVFTIVVKEKE